jgi:hypothetical protein
MLTSMKTGILMTINPCRDCANFAEQKVTEGAALCTKNQTTCFSWSFALAPAYEKVRYNA